MIFHSYQCVSYHFHSLVAKPDCIVFLCHWCSLCFTLTPFSASFLLRFIWSISRLRYEDSFTVAIGSMLPGSFFGCVSSVSRIPLVLVPSHQKMHRRLCLPFITPTNHPAFGLGHSSLLSCAKLGTENDSRKPCHHFAVNSKCAVPELTVCAQLDHGGFPRDYQNLLLVCFYSCVSLHRLDIVFPCIISRVFSDFMENELFISSSYFSSF